MPPPLQPIIAEMSDGNTDEEDDERNGNPDSDMSGDNTDDHIIDEEILDQDYNTIFEKLKAQWILAEIDHCVSKTANEAFWKISCFFFPKLEAALGRKKKIPQFKSIRRNIHKNLLPPIQLNIGYRDRSTGELTVVKDTVTPLKRFSPTKYEKLYEIGFVNIEDIKAIHSNHGHDEHEVMMSLDGVSESKSTTVSLDVYSVKFKGCRCIYPLKIIRQIDKLSVDNRKEFASVLSALIASHLIIQALIADNPKRAFLRNSLQHSGRHSCEYCFESGMLFTSQSAEEILSFLKNIEQQKKELRQQIELLETTNDSVQIDSLKSIIKHLNDAESMAKKRKKCSHIVWPANTFNGERRTKEKVLDIVEKIESGQEMSKEEKKGIKGRSIMLNLDYFDYVIGITTEYMHLVALGVVKRLLEVSFAVGETRTRIIKRPLASPSIFNECMKTIKFFHEFSRRARKLDLAVMKAQELRNVVLFFSQ